MTMPVVHFLNVKEGDCSVIQHGSGRVTVVDVCNAKPPESPEATMESRALILSNLRAAGGVRGNFNQKEYPVNPITYLRQFDIASVFRFILTHPDMDHLRRHRGILCRIRSSQFLGYGQPVREGLWGSAGGYNPDDWEFYKSLRDTDPDTSPKRLTLASGCKGQYYNQNEDGTSGADGLYVLAPTRELVQDANESGDYNDCSYVLYYKAAGGTVVFGGDSHDNTWTHILANHPDVKDVDLLIAPHHGRASDRGYEFLDTLKPKLTFFGNAKSEHLAYPAWEVSQLAFHH